MFSAPQLKRDPLGSNSSVSMNSDAYDDPKVEAAWLSAQRTHVHEYLRTERVPFGTVPDRPAWYLAPYVALWSVLGPKSGGIQYWVIVGDLPADFLPADALAQPRQAMAAFAERWRGVAGAMLEGRKHPRIEIGRPEDSAELGDLLLRRADLLAEFARDDQYW